MVAGVLMALGTTATAHAELGSPFGLSEHRCLADADVAPGDTDEASTTTGPVSQRRFLPVVQVTGDADGGQGGSANLDGNGTWGTHPRAIDDIGTDASYPVSPAVFWQTYNTLELGQEPRVSGDCEEREHGWETRADFHDRPSTPASFTGTRNHPLSRLGFMAPQAGRYVADVARLGVSGLRVAIESYTTFEGEWIEDGEARSATFEQLGSLDLGALSAGPHTVTVEGVQPGLLTTPPDQEWTVRIRQVVTEPAPVDPPVVVQPLGALPASPPSAPPPSAPQIAVAAVSATPTDRTKPKLTTRVRRDGRFRRIRVTCVNERCRLRVTVRWGKQTRVVRRDLARGATLSLRVRAGARRVRISILATDRAGNTRTLQRRG